jgi:integrase/recombinase XerD
VTQLRKTMLEELQRRNCSQTTVNGYLKVVAAFAKYFNCPPDQLGPEHIRAYQAYLFQEKNLNARTVNHHTAALRFFFCKTLRRAYLLEEAPYPKTPRRLPVILTREEAVRLINSASNLFHRAMLMTAYSTGMRRAEICHLKVEDIDSSRMLIRIRQGKGRRDRDVPLSPKLLETLREYWRWMKPKTYLFPGTVNGSRADKPITDKMLWAACRKQHNGQVSPNPFTRTYCATATRPICLKAAPIYQPCKPCSVMRISSPPPFICICRSVISKRRARHSTS